MTRSAHKVDVDAASNVSVTGVAHVITNSGVGCGCIRGAAPEANHMANKTKMYRGSSRKEESTWRFPTFHSAPRRVCIQLFPGETGLVFKRSELPWPLAGSEQSLLRRKQDKLFVIPLDTHYSHRQSKNSQVFFCFYSFIPSIY